MKLTNHIRNTFIRAVMDDVPSTDYGAEQQRVATDWAVSIMPLKVRAVWDDKKLRHYIEACSFSQRLYFDDINEGEQLWVSGFSIPAPHDLHEQMDDATKRTLYTLEAQSNEQHRRRRELREKLGIIVYALTTTAALEKALPEFAKYLPKATSKTENLPAVANLVTDFVKAGWTKEQTA